MLADLPDPSLLADAISTKSCALAHKGLNFLSAGPKVIKLFLCSTQVSIKFHCS